MSVAIFKSAVTTGVCREPVNDPGGICMYCYSKDGATCLIVFRDESADGYDRAVSMCDRVTTAEYQRIFSQYDYQGKPLPANPDSIPSLSPFS